MHVDQKLVQLWRFPSNIAVPASASSARPRCIGLLRVAVMAALLQDGALPVEGIARPWLVQGNGMSGLAGGTGQGTLRERPGQVVHPATRAPRLQLQLGASCVLGHQMTSNLMSTSCTFSTTAGNGGGAGATWERSETKGAQSMGPCLRQKQRSKGRMLAKCTSTCACDKKRLLPVAILVLRCQVSIPRWCLVAKATLAAAMERALPSFATFPTPASARANLSAKGGARCFRHFCREFLGILDARE